MEDEDTENFAINIMKKNDISNAKQSILLLYKSNLRHLSFSYLNKFDCIIEQNHITKRGKSSIWYKSNELISSKLHKLENNKIECLRDIHFWVWNTVTKDIPKWTRAESLRNSYFNLIDFSTFYAGLELIKSSFSTDLQESLFKIITLSRGFPEISRAASNAISILNKLGCSFNNADLQLVNIPYADLSYSLLINTNFKGSNLNSANFNQSNLYQVNFSNCNMENAKFFRSQPIRGDKKIGLNFNVSSCGRYLAASELCNDSKIRVWEIASDKLLKEIWYFDINSAKAQLNFSPNGKYISIIRGWEVALYELQNNCNEIIFGRFHKSFNSVAFSWCETCIAAGSLDNSIRVWNINSKELIAWICCNKSKVIDITFSLCSNFLYSTGSDMSILMWDLFYYEHRALKYYKKKGKYTQKLAKCFKEDRLISKLILSKCGKFIVCLALKISIWNVNIGEKIFLYDPTFIISTASFNQINLLAFRAEDGKIIAFDIETQDFIYQSYCQPCKTSKKVVFLQDGKSIAAASEGRVISFFNIWNPNYNKLIKASNHIFNSISFSPCSNYFVTHCGEGEIELWDLAQHKAIKNIDIGSPNYAAKVIIYSSYGSYIAVPKNSSVCIYSPHLDMLHELVNFENIKSIAISHNEKIIAAGSISILILWEVKDLINSIVKTRFLNFENNFIRYLGFTQYKEMLVAFRSDNKIKLIGNQKWIIINIIKKRSKINTILQVCPSNQYIAYTMESTLKIFIYEFNLSFGEFKTLISDASNPYSSLRFSPSGIYIAALSSKGIDAKPKSEIFIWHVERGELLASIKENMGLIACFEFTYSENIIAAGVNNCTVKFWDWQKYN